MSSMYLDRRLRSELEAERASSRAILDRAHKAQTVLAGGVNAIVAALREIEAEGYESYADALACLTNGAYDAIGELQGAKQRAAFDAQVDCPEPAFSIGRHG